MEIIVTSDYEAMSERAPEIIAEAVRKKPDLVLGLATGDTPLGVYKMLIRQHSEYGLDFSKVKSFNLDEYLGLDPEHKNSYHRFMRENFFSHINIDIKNVFIPEGNTNDPEKFCALYEEQITRAGGIDLQILGIGRNGHIGFNEPGSSFTSRTRVVSLHSETIEDNSRFFKKTEDVPHQAITMGIGTILEARKILLIASGSNKAKICARFIEGPVTEQVPASTLQRHSDVTVVLDGEAASQLKKKTIATGYATIN